MPDASIRQALEKLWSASTFAGSPVTDAKLDDLGCVACGTDSPAVLDCLAEKVFMLVIPFCAYNSVGYREQVRAQLSGGAVPTNVPNSTALQPVLIPSRYGSKITRDRNGRPARDATNPGKRLS